MSLHEEHKADRKARILAEARRLIARHGFEGLTMRDVADAARVSVPTVYNLVGNKYALVEALVEEHFADFISALGAEPPGDGLVEQVLAVWRASHRLLLATPAYTRALVHVFLTTEDASPIRRVMDQRSVDMMAETLRAAQRSGELVSWVDPVVVSRTMYGIYVHKVIGWAANEIDDEGLPVFVTLGWALILLGLARGRTRERLESLIRDEQTSAGRLLASQAKGA